MLFAEPYQLGWDPTICVHRQRGHETQYDITVEDHDGTQTTYRSVELLFFNPEGDPAKATRIWKAVELHEGLPRGAPVVLKDVWRYEELDQEGDNIKAIQSSTDLEDTQGTLSKGLLTVLHHGDVILRSDTARDPPHLDNTRIHVGNVCALARGAPMQDSRIVLPTKRVGPHPGWNGRSSVQGRRIHYRIVFKKVCTPLLKASLSISAMCTAVAEIAQGA